MTTNQQAADALMDALEDWARSLGDAGVTTVNGKRYFPSRQIDRSMRRAHAEGRLFEELTHWLPTYRGLRTKQSDQAYADRMRDIVEHGCPLWEDVVSDPTAPWASEITSDQRAILRQVRADVDNEIARGKTLQIKMLADLRKRRTGHA